MRRPAPFLTEYVDSVTDLNEKDVRCNLDLNTHNLSIYKPTFICVPIHCTAFFCKMAYTFWLFQLSTRGRPGKTWELFS